MRKYSVRLLNIITIQTCWLMPTCAREIPKLLSLYYTSCVCHKELVIKTDDRVIQKKSLICRITLSTVSC